MMALLAMVPEAGFGGLIRRQARGTFFAEYTFRNTPTSRVSFVSMHHAHVLKVLSVISALAKHSECGTTLANRHRSGFST